MTARFSLSLCFMEVLALAGMPSAAPPPGNTDGTRPRAAHQSAESHGAAKDLYGDRIGAGARARLGTLRYRPGYFTSLAFTSGGRQIATFHERSWYSGRRISFLDVATGRRVRRLDFGEDDGHPQAISADGRWIATVSGHYDRITQELSTFIQVRNGRSGRVEHDFGWTGARGSSLNRLAFSPDSRFLIALDGHGTFHVWELDSRREGTSVPVRSRRRAGRLRSHATAKLSP